MSSIYPDSNNAHIYSIPIVGLGRFVGQEDKQLGNSEGCFFVLFGRRAGFRPQSNGLALIPHRRKKGRKDGRVL